MVTPPVCFAAFAAAGIAGSKLMETGWEATRLSAAGIIVPFYFVYHPGILLIGDLLAIIEGVSRASLGLYAAGRRCDWHPGFGFSGDRFLNRGGDRPEGSHRADFGGHGRAEHRCGGLGVRPDSRRLRK